MNEPEPIDPAMLQEGDLFRGSNWKKGKNHVHKEIITQNNGDMLIASLCNYWFRSYSIHEPLPDKKENNCKLCQRRRDKRSCR